MADRARGEVAADDAYTARCRQLEYFPTPPWAGRAIGEALAALDPGAWWCWDPACGEGHLAYGLQPYFARVHATDIHDWTAEVGSCVAAGSLQVGPPLDFLDRAADAVDQADWIVFNPPFGTAAEFVEVALRRARRGVAVLCRSGWLDTGGRYPLFFGDRPCDLELAFFDRVAMSLGGWQPKSTEKGGSTATAYSLFVWFQDVTRPSWIDDLRAMARANLPLALNGTPIAGMTNEGILTLGIPPGTKSRLSWPGDARLWGKRSNADAPLFEGNDHG